MIKLETHLFQPYVPPIVRQAISHKNRWHDFGKLLDGLHFVVTGKLECYTRAEIKTLILELGGSIDEMPNAYTSYVIAGNVKNGIAGDRSRKILAAEKHFTTIISEKHFDTMLDQLSRKSD